MCEALDGWGHLSGARQCRLASLLHSMCLYRPLLTLIPANVLDGQCADADTIELAYWRASANFMHHLPGRIADYHCADLSVFEHIALSAPAAAPARFNATAMVFVHKAKSSAPVGELVQWHGRLENALALVVGSMDEFTAQLFTSRFYRAGISASARRRSRRSRAGYAARGAPRMEYEAHDPSAAASLPGEPPCSDGEPDQGSAMAGG